MSISMGHKTKAYMNINVNDFVMLRSDAVGDPYFIGRIMSIPDPTQVVIQWFYRPQDILKTRARGHPSRQLLATMYSDTNPRRAIVDKCVVRHVSEIADLVDYCSQPNHFYFEHLYERFIKRLYDVVPSSKVTNRPPKVLEKLRQFPYVLIEEGKEGELTKPYLECKICDQWIEHGSGLHCALCDLTYHRHCLPGVNRARAGFEWVCHWCFTGAPNPHVPPAAAAVDMSRSRGIDRNSSESPLSDMDGFEDDQSSVSSAPAGGVGTGGHRRSTRRGGGSGGSAGGLGGTDVSKAKNLAHLWPLPPPPVVADSYPFTYFGLNCSNEEALELDPRHPLLPRLASRVGTKYQAAIPAWEEPSSSHSPAVAAIPAVPSSPGASKAASPTVTGGGSSLRGGGGNGSSSNSTQRRKAKEPASPGDGIRQLVLAHTGVPASISIGEYFASSPDRSDPDSGILFRGSWEDPRVAAAVTKLNQMPQMGELRDRFPFDLVNLMDRVMYELDMCDYDPTAAMEVLESLSFGHLMTGTCSQETSAQWAARYPHKQHQRDVGAWVAQANLPIWTPEAHATLLDLVSVHGFDPVHVHAAPALRNRSLRNIVQRMYQRQHHEDFAAALAKYTAKHPAAAGFVSGDSVTAASPMLTSSAAPGSSQLLGEGGGGTSGSGSGGFALAAAGAGISRPASPVSDDEEPEDVDGVACTVCGGPSSTGKFVLTNVLRTAPRSTADLQLTVSRSEMLTGGADRHSCHIMCDQCGRYWMRYASIRSIPPATRATRSQTAGLSATSSTASIKRERSGSLDDGELLAPVAKRSRRRSQLVSPGDDAVSDGGGGGGEGGSARKPVPRCALCHEFGGRILWCQDCDLHVHESCFGTTAVTPSGSVAPSPSTTLLSPLGFGTSSSGSGADSSTDASATSPESAATVVRRWRCGPCANQRQPTHALEVRCVLCPRSTPTTPPAVFKRTAGHNWVHMLCAMWMPETQFGSAESLEPVLGIADVPPSEHAHSACHLCGLTGGAVVPCDYGECTRQFHVHCAHRAGQMFTVEPRQSPTGIMQVAFQITCRAHHISDSQLDPGRTVGKITPLPVVAGADIALPIHDGAAILAKGGNPFPPVVQELWKRDGSGRVPFLTSATMQSALAQAKFSVAPVAAVTIAPSLSVAAPASLWSAKLFGTAITGPETKSAMARARTRAAVLASTTGRSGGSSSKVPSPLVPLTSTARAASIHSQTATATASRPFPPPTRKSADPASATAMSSSSGELKIKLRISGGGHNNGDAMSPPVGGSAASSVSASTAASRAATPTRAMDANAPPPRGPCALCGSASSMAWWPLDLSVLSMYNAGSPDAFVRDQLVQGVLETASSTSAGSQPSAADPTSSSSVTAATSAAVKCTRCFSQHR